MNEKTYCYKKNTASQRHLRSSILNNISAYLAELQLREKSNADQAKNIFFYLLHICIQSQKGLIFINKIKNTHFEVVYLVYPNTSKEHLQSCCSK